MVIRHHPKIGHLWVRNQVARIPHERGGYIVRTNGQGFRSDIEFQEKRSATSRILFFGDSMTAGDGCYNHERFAEQVGGILGVEVYNYGLSGSGTDQQLLIFEELAQNVEAELIVVAVNVENIDRVRAAYRPTMDRVTRRRLLVPKPSFKLNKDGELLLEGVPVPLERPEEWAASARVHSPTATREANPHLKNVYRFVDLLRNHPRFRRLGGMVSPRSFEDYTKMRSVLLRLFGFDPYPSYKNMGSEDCRLMEAILRRFIEAAKPRPLLIVPIPSHYHYLDLLEPTYRDFYGRFNSPEDNVHVLDLTTPLRRLPLAERRKLPFCYDAHFSPTGHRKVAELIADEIRRRRLLNVKSVPSAKSQAVPRVKSLGHTYILGISCFYHNSAASLIRDGEIVAAAEEERFSRLKNDRRFPASAINYCLEEAGLDVSGLAAVVYYDNTQLTFERLMHTAVEMGERARDFWKRVIPSWVQYKLRLPSLIQRYLNYDGLVLQNIHHRSHAASAFFPSPFSRAAILTVDGVGEWATASIGLGQETEIKLLKEMRFPHSLGLLYSAFTQFTGFKVNSGEYKMMGLAPYGRPIYVDTILNNIVDLKDDGSVELNMDSFGFLSEPTMTNERFAALFGGPARSRDARITQREMDIARSIQSITEEAMLRMAREAHRLTGEKLLCMAGGVALNCVANGRILREGPFEDIWIQPAAGDAGASLGAALDAYHTYFGRPRVYLENRRPLLRASHIGPDFSDDEIEGFLQTYGYPYHKLKPEERPRVVARALSEGNVVGHFAGRSEFGPRALGSRSILGDPRNQQMQTTLNLKIKYRESFRPFAPTVLRERVSDYFELDRESPYMLIVAPVREERQLPFDRGGGEDLLEVVRMPRSDIPAVTHIDYSARIQTIAREDHPAYYDVLKAFEQFTACGVLVNTSFNVRGEPIVNTPLDAYRCFMRTEMDALVLGHFWLFKKEQPPWPEEKGHLEEGHAKPFRAEPRVLRSIMRIFDRDFSRAAGRIRDNEYEPLIRPFKSSTTTWTDYRGPDRRETIFTIPSEMLDGNSESTRLAMAIIKPWSNSALARQLAPTIAKLLHVAKKWNTNILLSEEVPESIYVMF